MLIESELFQSLTSYKFGELKQIMNRSGKRTVVRGPKDVAFENYEIEPGSPTEFIVKNIHTAISSGTELSIYTGANPRVYEANSWCEYPHVPGYAGLAKVVEVGSEVSGVSVGDFVFHHAHHSSFDRIYEGRSNYAKIPKELLRPDVSLVRFAAIVLSGAVRPSKIELGDNIALIGLGLIGQMAAQLFNLSGGEIYAFDPVEMRRKTAERIGACRRIFDPAQETIFDFVPSGIDTLVDATGISSLILSNMKLVKPMGQVILLGTPFDSFETDLTGFLREIHLKRLTVRGALERDQVLPGEFSEGRSYISDVKYLLSLIERKKLKTADLLSAVMKPEEIKLAYDSLLNEKEELLSVVLDWQKN